MGCGNPKPALSLWQTVFLSASCVCVWFVPFTSSLLCPSSLFVWCVNVFSLAFIILFPFPALVGKKKRQRKELFAWLAHIFSTSFYHVDHFLRPFSAWLQIKLFHISLCVLSTRVCECECVRVCEQVWLLPSSLSSSPLELPSSTVHGCPYACLLSCCGFKS